MVRGTLILENVQQSFIEVIPKLGGTQIAVEKSLDLYSLCQRQVNGDLIVTLKPLQEVSETVAPLFIPHFYEEIARS